MGNRFSRRREAQISSSGTVATEQKTVAEPTTTNQAEDSELTQTQEEVETEKTDVMAEESLTPEACSPKDECVSGSKEEPSPVASALKNDAESEPTPKESPAPEQPEPLISAVKPPEPKAFEQPEPAAEARLALKPDPGSDPEPEPASHTEADEEPSSDPVPLPAEPLEQHADLLSQEFLPESVLSSPPLIDLGVLDVSSSPNIISVSLDPDESDNLSAEAAGGSPLETEKLAETSEFLEKPMEVEAAECLKMPGSDVEENVSEILKNSELKGNDLLNDLIQSEVKIPDDTPLTNLGSSVELM